VGVGYRAGVKGKQLEMTLGFSHPIVFDIPAGIEIKVDKQTHVDVIGSNRALVGQVAAKIRGFKPPEPYLGKGVKYSDEVIRKKAGKAAGK
jgi:large subunit ribosomal protein L6